jgi:hypothetical protein
MSATASSELLSIRQHGGGAAGVFKVLFWVHQIILGLPSVGYGLDLLVEGKVQGVISVIGIFLAWIGGTLVWGFGALMHQRMSYDLPPIFATINENIARLETMQVHASAASAVADALGTEHETAAPPAPEH